MRIGIGLPAAVPGADMTTLGRWAAESERAGFAAVGVIDRLVYANLDPLIALAVAAGRTERVDLVTTVLSIGWRNNPILVAKQMASLDLVSGGRLLAGLGLGGWPEDYLASRVPQAGNAAGWESSLAAMRQGMGREAPWAALLRCADQGRLKRRPRSWIRSPGPVRRMRLPLAGSLVPRRPVRSVRAEGSARRRVRRRSLWHCGPASARASAAAALQPPVVALDPVVGVLLGSMPRCRQQLLQHDRVGCCSVRDHLNG